MQGLDPALWMACYAVWYLWETWVSEGVGAHTLLDSSRWNGERPVSRQGGWTTAPLHLWFYFLPFNYADNSRNNLCFKYFCCNIFLHLLYCISFYFSCICVGGYMYIYVHKFVHMYVHVHVHVCAFMWEAKVVRYLLWLFSKLFFEEVLSAEPKAR